MVVEQREGPTSNGLLTYSYQENVILELQRLETPVGPAVADFGPFGNIFETLVVVAVRRQRVSDQARKSGLHKSRDGRIEFLCMRSLVNYWSHIFFDMLFKDVPDRSFEAMAVRNLLEELETEGSYAFWRPLDREPDSWEGPIVVGSLGYLSKVAAENPDRTVLASGYSTIDYTECSSPFQSARDPVGLRIEKGRISSPPLYSRPIVLQNATETKIVRPEEISCLFKLPGSEDLIRMSYDACSTAKVYERGHNGQWTTPSEQDRVDLVVIEDRIVALCIGGGVEIPRAGFVISMPQIWLTKDRLNTLRANNDVRYILDPDHCPLVEPYFGIQCGPTLIHRSEVQLSPKKLIDEDFAKGSKVLDIAPRNVWKSTGDARAARSLVGVDTEGKAHLLVAAGTSTDVQHSGNSRAFGATFSDMATLAASEGLTEAMSLDSGGSVSLFDRGKPVFQGGDFRGTENIIERPLAHAILAKGDQ